MNSFDKEYLYLFLFGTKSAHMKSIESRFPDLDGFKRREAILHFIGCPSISFKRGWLMFLPANQHAHLHWDQHMIIGNFILFAFYYMRRKK